MTHLHSPSIKLLPLCFALSACNGLCAPSGIYEQLKDQGAANDMAEPHNDPEMGQDVQREDMPDLNEMGEMGEMGGCVPTTQDAEEEWRCDGVDNDCDGLTDEHCHDEPCPSQLNKAPLQSINNNTQLVLYSTRTPNDLRPSNEQDTHWILTFSQEDLNTQPYHWSINRLNKLEQNEPRTAKNECTSSTQITPYQGRQNKGHLTFCDNNLTLFDLENNSPTSVWDNNTQIYPQSVPSKADKADWLTLPTTIISTTNQENTLWVSFINDVNGAVYPGFSSCAFKLDYTAQELSEQNIKNCKIIQKSPSTKLTYIKKSNNTPQTPAVHYTSEEGIDVNFYYTSPSLNNTHPNPKIDNYTTPTLITTKKQAEHQLSIFATTPLNQNKNTLKMHTTSFETFPQWNTLELLPNNHHNRWPTSTSAPKAPSGDHSNVFLAWQLDDRLVMSILDPLNPTTITPKPVSQAYTSTTDIRSAVAVGPHGFGIAWTVNEGGAQNLYFQAINFQGQYICDQKTVKGVANQ